MEKNKIQDFPVVVMPAVLLATEDNGKINFALHGQYGLVTMKPFVIHVSVIKGHLTAQNILKTKKFSINFPDKTIFEKMIYCGNVSGNEEDKSNIFKTFYGNIKVPMIEECRVNYVCEVIKEIEINNCYMFLGEIKETYINKNCLNGTIPDIIKIDPLLCSIGKKFWTINELKK
jgi:flavin reductase (DIM6/NTAB) family NADH-FMN oxidoreductase RutF